MLALARCLFRRRHLSVLVKLWITITCGILKVLHVRACLFCPLLLSQPTFSPDETSAFMHGIRINEVVVHYNRMMTFVLCRHWHFCGWDTRRSFIVYPQVLNLQSVVRRYITRALDDSRWFETEWAVVDPIFRLGALLRSIVVRRMSTWSLLAFRRWRYTVTKAALIWRTLEEKHLGSFINWNMITNRRQAFSQQLRLLQRFILGRL